MPIPARDSQTSPYLSGIQDQRSFHAIFPIATGGLPLNPQVWSSSGAPTGSTATGSINGNPSGVPIYWRTSGQDMLLTRVSAGLYELKLQPAPNGVVKAWMEFNTLGPRVLQVTKRDLPTGYVQITVKTASGTTFDPANGEAVGIEYVAFATGAP